MPFGPTHPMTLIAPVARRAVCRAVCVLAASALLGAVPGAAAEPMPDGEAFHFAPGESLALEPAELREPLSSGVTACAQACVRHTDAHGHMYSFQAAGEGRPVRTVLWVEVTRHTLGPDACVLQAFVQVLAPNGESKWYWSYCVGVQVLEPGLHEVAFEWPADFSSVAIVPGDVLYAEVWTASTSMPLAPAVFLVADADHPSYFVMSGVRESQEPQQAPRAEPPPASTGSRTSAPTSMPTTTTRPPAPTSTTGPEPETTQEEILEPTTAPQEPATASAASAAGTLTAVTLLASVWAVRRRLD